MKKILILAMLFFSTHITAPAFGQGFFNKLKKAVEKVDEGLNKALNTNQAAAEPQESSEVPAAETAKTASKASNVVRLYVSPNTKTIQLKRREGFMGYNFDDFTDFSDGVAFVKDANKKRWAMMDTQGNYLTPFVFDFNSWKDLQFPFPRYDSGVCMVRSLEYPTGVKYNTPTALILDKTGKVTKTIPSISSYTNFKDGVARVRQVFRDEERSTSVREELLYKYRFIDTQGEFIYPHLDIVVRPTRTQLTIPDVAEMRGVSEGLRAYWSYKSGWGYIDEQGKVVVEPAYRMAHDFREGLAAVQNYEENWGFIDQAGNLVIDYIYSREPSDFVDGLAIVTKRDGSRCYIDTKGNIVLDKLSGGTIWMLYPFFNNKTFAVCADGEVVIDRNFNVIANLPNNSVLNDLVDYANGIYYFRAGAAMNDSYQIMRYDDGTEFGFRKEGLSKIIYDKMDNSMCYIAPDGEIKIIFKEPEF